MLFRSSLQLTAPTLVSVSVDGATNSPGTSGSDEVTLDIDVAGSVAQGARIAVYFAPWTQQGWVDIVTTAIHDATNKPSVLSISWGWPEFETISGLTWSNAAINAVSETFQDAVALGVTIFAASGDSGSSCGIEDAKAHVLYPASDPGVTACGGTTISNVSGSSFTQSTWTPKIPRSSRLLRTQKSGSKDSLTSNDYDCLLSKSWIHVSKNWRRKRL